MGDDVLWRGPDGPAGRVLAGTNTYTGITSILSGTLKHGVVNALPATTILHVGSTYDLNGFDQTVSSIGTSAGTITNTGSSATLTDDEASTVSVGATITGDLNLVMNGTGTLTLAAGNTYTGATTVAQGTLQDGVANGLPATTTLNVNTGATFDLNGNDQTVASLGASVGTITNNGSTGATLTDNETGTSTVVAALTDGTNHLNFTMNGPGTLTLGDADSYTGTTTVAQGTLVIANPGELGTSPVSVASSGKLDVEGGLTVSNTITDLAGKTTDTSGTDTWSSRVALDAAGGSIAAHSGATLTLSGVVSGGDLTVGASGQTGPSSSRMPPTPSVAP